MPSTPVRPRASPLHPIVAFPTAATRPSWSKSSEQNRHTRRHKLHELRHTFATLVLESGAFDMFELSRLMGHASVAITDKVYRHLRKKDYATQRALFSAFVAGEIITPARRGAARSLRPTAHRAGVDAARRAQRSPSRRAHRRIPPVDSRPRLGTGSGQAPPSPLRRTHASPSRHRAPALRSAPLEPRFVPVPSRASLANLDHRPAARKRGDQPGTQQNSWA
ncbi:tyrosine-type recombinase/integrase [Curtobacterium flaccumfaciens pv. oortii]|nr:tyrosine-type recombinase/integrase [Curtobacterium flaccumfaciens pv. oortii]